MHTQRKGHINAPYTSVKTVWSCWAQELYESQGAPNSPYGLCGRKVTMSNWTSCRILVTAAG